MRNILDNKKAIIFDLDGTLVHLPKKTLITRVTQALNKAQLSPKTEKQILEFYKKHEWDETLEEWGFDLKQQKLFWKDYIGYVENSEQNGTLPYQDTIPTLSSLKSQGKKIAIMTSSTKKYLQRQIEKLGKEFIDYGVFVGSNLNLAQKPSPEGIYHISYKLGIPVRNLVFVGDSDLDIKTAQNAGCLDVLVDRGNGCLDIPLKFQSLITPSIKIKSLTELI